MISIVTLSPGLYLPMIWLTSLKVGVRWPSTFRITSPAFRPALAAGRFGRDLVDAGVLGRLIEHHADDGPIAEQNLRRVGNGAGRNADHAQPERRLFPGRA